MMLPFMSVGCKDQPGLRRGRDNQAQVLPARHPLPRHSVVGGGLQTPSPPLDHFRQYYPNELFPQEKSWIPSIFGPVQEAYLMFSRLSGAR
jgi:hypothetical protein